MMQKDEQNRVLSSYKEDALRVEEQTFFEKAAFSRDHSRYLKEEEDHRLPYQRDVDRLVNSKAYSRYIDKTQVVYLVADDHITHRSLHVQLVSNFARGVAKRLHLNEELVEVIALGHDVGHPPFGHEGEGYLSELSFAAGNGFFVHNEHSCRLLREIEPLNLGLAVYDGFLCHSGGLVASRLKPVPIKTWPDHFNELEQRKKDPSQNIWPMTLEGCLVKLCDKISYIGRDLEDAHRLGLIERQEIPKTCLGNTNREILHVVAKDVQCMSYGKDEIVISDEVYDALKIMRKFNFERIYNHPKLKVESKRIKRAYSFLFEEILQNFTEKKEASLLFSQYLLHKTESYLASTSPVQMVVDYIAGMTDRFFLRTLESLILPKKIEML
ncbi:MAG: HD domain-containing protein [Chlamydiales bacterium]|nr:HD domain-containing protein [Chlamydiales bacterium]